MKIAIIDSRSSLEARSNTDCWVKAYEEVADQVKLFDYRTMSAKAMLIRITEMNPNLVHMGKCETLDGYFVKEMKLYTKARVIHYYGDFRLTVQPFVLSIGKEADKTYFAHFDYALVDKYKGLGVKDIGFMAVGVDPDLYAIDYEVLYPEYDFCFMGSYYPDSDLPGHEMRTEVIEYLRDVGYRMLMHGSGWEKLGLECHSFVIGKEYARACHNAHFTLNVSGMLDVQFGTSWPRSLRCMVTGVDHISYDIPGLREMFPAAYYFTEPKQIDDIYGAVVFSSSHTVGHQGRISQREVIEKHTFVHRVKKILEGESIVDPYKTLG